MIRSVQIYWYINMFFSIMLCTIFEWHTVQAQPIGLHIPPDTLKLSRLTIAVYDVFDSTESFYKFRIAWLANALHISTKPRIIRRELLFLSDSLITVPRLIESAHNLRNMNIFQGVTLSVDTLAQGYGDVRVAVKDYFTTQISTAYSIEGGKHRISAGLEEKNIAGLGYRCAIDASNKEDREFLQVNYLNPRFFNTRFINTLVYKRYKDATLASLELDKCFYSQETQWDGGADYMKSTGKQVIYTSSSEYIKTDHFTEKYSLHYGYYWGDYVRKRIGFHIYHLNERWIDVVSPFSVTSVSGGKEYNRRIRRISCSIGAIHRSISVHQNIDRSDVDEDIHIGFMANGGIGYESPKWGADKERFVYSISGVYGSQITTNNYVFAELNDGRTTTVNTSEEHITNARLTFFSTSIEYHTIAARAEFNYLNLPHPYFQLYLGEDTGLRGYANREFIANQRFVIGIEDRIFTPFQLWFVRFGAAIFIDGGTVWNGTDELKTGQWHMSTGLGLRLGIPKISRGIIRIDCAYNVDRKRFMTLSLSNGSFFNVLYPIGFGIQNFLLSVMN